MNDEQYIDVMRQLASNEQEHKSFRRRLDDHDKAIDEQNKIFLALQKQSDAIESMNKSVGRVEKKVDGISGRVDALEKEPADKWKKTTWEVVKYLLLAVVGLVVGLVLKTPVP